MYTLARCGAKEFPAFYTSGSGFEAPYNCRDEAQLAEIIRCNLESGLGAGMLIGNLVLLFSVFITI